MAASNWFDLLPLEVCILIATHLSRGFQTASALSLAQTTPKLCQAVLQTLSHQYRLPRSRRRSGMGSPLQWARIFGSHIQKLHLDTLDDQLIIAATYLLQMPSLKRVTLPDDPRLMAAIAARSEWEEVGVLIRGREGLEVARHGLRGVDTVKVICATGIAGEVCGMEALEGMEGIRRLYVECDVGGRHFGTRAVGEEVWRNVLKGVKEVSFVGGVPDGARWCLGAIESVSVAGTGALQVGAEARGNCRQIVCDEVLDAVGELESCTEMEELGVRIRGGLEGSLGRVIENMEGLRVLRLGWKIEGAYYRVEGEWLEKLIGRLRHLEGLYLKAVVIEGAELERILEQMGSRLTGLEVPILGQDEKSLERLKRVLLTLCKFNTELRHFGVNEEKDAVGMFDEDETRRVGRQVFQGLQRLKRRAPMWRAAQLEYFVRCRLLGMGGMFDVQCGNAVETQQRALTWVLSEVFAGGSPAMARGSAMEFL